jgi:hypothetical protein
LSDIGRREFSAGCSVQCRLLVRSQRKASKCRKVNRSWLITEGVPFSLYWESVTKMMGIYGEKLAMLKTCPSMYERSSVAYCLLPKLPACQSPIAWVACQRLARAYKRRSTLNLDDPPYGNAGWKGGDNVRQVRDPPLAFCGMRN